MIMIKKQPYQYIEFSIHTVFKLHIKIQPGLTLHVMPAVFAQKSKLTVFS